MGYYSGRLKCSFLRLLLFFFNSEDQFLFLISLYIYFQMLEILLMDSTVPVAISENMLEEVYLAISFPDKQRYSQHIKTV